MTASARPPATSRLDADALKVRAGMIPNLDDDERLADEAYTGNRAHDEADHQPEPNPSGASWARAFHDRHSPQRRSCVVAEPAGLSHVETIAPA